MNAASTQNNNDRRVAIWLLVVAFVIYCMIILGGVTRLTHSGLSMVDWNPIMGVVPPLSDSQWLSTFERYKQFPEYQKVNKGMTLGEFKRIFFFEYFHRVLGRLIGVLFLLPFLYFWITGMLSRPLVPRVIVMFILGGLQGVLGWYMVKSGLVDNPMVSQYRLTAHLMAAVLIYGYILWIAVGLLSSARSRDDQDTLTFWRWAALALVFLIAIMIASGGFVAGTRAGLVYNTFPLMAGGWVPEGMYTLQPFWLNWFENATAIQFNHRLIAYLLLLLVPLFAFGIRKSTLTESIRAMALLLLLVFLIQVCLGIATLLLRVPVVLAATHQGAAIILLTVAIVLARQLSIKSKATADDRYF